LEDMDETGRTNKKNRDDGLPNFLNEFQSLESRNEPLCLKA
jgi:hypothetical protein